MNRLCLAGVAGILGGMLASPALTAAPGSSVSPDLSAYATAASVSAIRTSIPSPCATTPLPDTLAGVVGSGTPCVLRPDTARPTVIQAAIVTTDSSGNWTVAWAKPFASATPYINPQAINTGGQPYICNVTSSTSSSAMGRCWQTVTMTLPSLATALLGLVLNPTSAAGSIQVRVAAREATQ